MRPFVAPLYFSRVLTRVYSPSCDDERDKCLSEGDAKSRIDAFLLVGYAWNITLRRCCWFPFSFPLLTYLFIHFFLIILSSPSNKYVELVFDDANWLLTIRWENSLEWATHSLVGDQDRLIRKSGNPFHGLCELCSLLDQFVTSWMAQLSGTMRQLQSNN